MTVLGTGFLRNLLSFLKLSGAGMAASCRSLEFKLSLLWDRCPRPLSAAGSGLPSSTRARLSRDCAGVRYREGGVEYRMMVASECSGSLMW